MRKLRQANRQLFFASLSRGKDVSVLSPCKDAWVITPALMFTWVPHQCFAKEMMMGKGSQKSSEAFSPEPLFSANSVRALVSVGGNPLRLIFREKGQQDDSDAGIWGLIGGKVTLRECYKSRLAMELAQEARLRIVGSKNTIRPVTTLHTPRKTIRNYPVWKVAELGYHTRGLKPNELVTLSNPLTVVFFCRADGELPEFREGRRLLEIDFSDPKLLKQNLQLVKRRHRKIVQLWVRHQLFGHQIPPFLEFGKAVTGTAEQLALAFEEPLAAAH